MFSRKQRVAVSFLIIAVCPLLVSCSDDNPTDPGNGGNGGTVPGQAPAQAAVDAVTPVLIQGYLGGYAQLLGASDFPTSQCVPIEGACESGSAEWCPSMDGGTVNFAGCMNAGVTGNGSIAISGNALAGTSTFDVTFNDVGVVGIVGYAFNTESNCLTESYQNLVITSGGQEYYLNGSVVYCLSVPTIAPAQGDPVVPTSAGLSIEVPREGQESLYITMSMNNEPPGSFEISVYDAQINEVIASCSGNILTKAMECFDPPEEEF